MFGVTLMGKNFTPDRIKQQINYLTRKGFKKALWMVHVGNVTPNLSDDYNEYRQRELSTLFQLRDYLHSQVQMVPLKELLYC